MFEIQTKNWLLISMGVDTSTRESLPYIGGNSSKLNFCIKGAIWVSIKKKNS